jgi:hypothetical protein
MTSPDNDPSADDDTIVVSEDDPFAFLCYGPPALIMMVFVGSIFIRRK